VLGKVAQVEGLNQSAAQVDYGPWQDFQRWLELGDHRVVVPFAEGMADLIPPTAVRLRRDVGQVIRAIKAHALLHREQRQRDDAGQIIADLERDYAIVRELLNPILAEASGVAVTKAMEETIAAVAKATIGMTESEGANAQDIAHVLKLDKSAAWRRLSAARLEGFIVNLEQRKGMPGKYRVAAQPPEPLTILPRVPELAEQFYTRSSLSPLKPVQPCNRDQIAEGPLADNGCTDDCVPDANDCIPVAHDLATDKSPNGNGNSPPVARMHDFSGDRGTHTNGAVCQRCGASETTDSPIQLSAINGEQFLLHRRCQADWLNETDTPTPPDLSIPPFLQRGSNNG
jgi:hypothetical protein